MTPVITRTGVLVVVRTLRGRFSGCEPFDASERAEVGARELFSLRQQLLELRHLDLRGCALERLSLRCSGLERFDRRAEHGAQLREHRPQFRRAVEPFEGGEPIEQGNVGGVESHRHAHESICLHGCDHSRIV